MNTRDLKNERKRFNEQYAIDYPSPDKKIEVQTRNNVMIILWGLVAFAGAIISFPHTLGAIMPTLNLPSPWNIVVACAVFVGVEGALIGVAYSEMAKSLEAGKRPAPLTLFNMFRIVLFRIGISTQLPAPASEDNHNSNGLLLIILFGSALLFNQADASKNDQLIIVSKYVAGAIAPLLILIAGHEFAHELASRVLAGKIANRHYEAKLDEWTQRRDEEWRKKSATFTTPSPAKEVGSVPLSTPISAPNLSKGWNGVGMGDGANGRTTKPVSGNGGDASTEYLMSPTE